MDFQAIRRGRSVRSADASTLAVWPRQRPNQDPWRRRNSGAGGKGRITDCLPNLEALELKPVRSSPKHVLFVEAHLDIYPSASRLYGSRRYLLVTRCTNERAPARRAERGPRAAARAAGMDARRAARAVRAPAAARGGPAPSRRVVGRGRADRRRLGIGIQ